jgi:AbrB family looped-hinge helix DNA binding protein
MNFNMGRRQIRRVNYTRTISLPKVWLDTVGLKEGDNLDLEMTEDGSLVLRPQRGGTDAKAVQ